MAIQNYHMDTITQFVGRELGVSDWVEISQDRINQFADCTGDRQWIHVDPERARRDSPFGTTIAHGYLTLSLIGAMVLELGVVPPDAASGLNYGCARARTWSLPSRSLGRASCSSCNARSKSRVKPNPPWWPRCCAC